jgi:hypothetical protein
MRPLIDGLTELDQRESIRSKNFTYLSFGADPDSYVFYDVDHLTDRWSTLFDVRSVVPEAHHFQTGILLQV